MWVNPVAPVGPFSRLFLSPNLPANRQTGQPAFKDIYLAHSRKLTHHGHGSHAARGCRGRS